MEKRTLQLLLVFCGPFLFGQVEPTAVGPLPSERQVRWHEMEMYCLIHFGPNTFLDQEWGFGDANPSAFNPSSFDALEIVQAVKSGGLRGVILVAKHHDGFCLWPTATTPYNISRSPWKNGRGDIVREFADACRAGGLAFGVYCSPWDRNSSLYGTPEYVDLYRTQLRELFTKYGDLFVSWHDGANGGSGYYGGARTTRTVDRATYYEWDSTWAMTRLFQPGSVIFSDVGPDVRWVGNENGIAGETHWHRYSPHAPDPGRKAAPGYVLEREATVGHGNGIAWMPAECDVPLRPGWFYHASQDSQVKTADQLFDIYLTSVGRGAALDIGLAPDTRGLLHENDVRVLSEFGNRLRAVFNVNLARSALVHASQERKSAHGRWSAQRVVDGIDSTYWATEDGETTATLTIELDSLQQFDLIMLKEPIRFGQRIDRFHVDVWKDNAWINVTTGTTIGYKKTVRMPQLTASRVRISLHSSIPCILISEIGLYLSTRG